MNNIFKYSDNNKRYHTLDYFYKHKFNSKVFKVSLNAGLSCPNIDGTVGKVAAFIALIVVVVNLQAIKMMI